MGKPNTILVTGGAGYIGSHTIIELINNGFDVISADNFNNTSPKTFERIHKITNVRVKNYDTDLTDLNATKKIFIENSSIIGIIHFAAFKSVPDSVAKPIIYYQNNLGALMNILECTKLFDVSNFIFSSSCSVYGNVKKLPVNELTPTGEVECPYAYSKLVGERIIQDLVKVTPKVKTVSLRYFNPVGAHISGLIGEVPLVPNNLVPVITQTAIGKLKELVVYGNDYKTRDGTSIRDYIHVSDIADAHVKALQYLKGNINCPGYDLFNLGSGNGVTVLEAIKAFEKVSGQKLNYRIGPRRAGDVDAIYSDSSKANNLLNWKPRHDIDSMMKTAWDWEQNITHGTVK